MMDTNASISPYTRYPLGPTQTRLLRIDSIGQDETLRCSFKVIDLGFEKPSYYAISYFWGEEPQTMDKVTVDGLSISVWPSHVKLLRGIAHFFEDRAVKNPYIWVDAVCIDQENQTEKEAQVKHMDLVYKGADSVLIWLGEEHPETDMALTVMQWLGRRVLPAAIFAESRFPIPTMSELENQCRDQFDISSQELNLLHNATRDQASTENVMSYTHHIWRGWHKIVTRPWFTRVWTLQELLLARQAFFICGKKYVNWQSLQQMVKNPLSSGRILGLKSNELRNFMDSYINVYSLMIDKERADYMVDKSNEVKFYMSYLILSGARRKLQAGEKQDHIYGILGLVKPEVRKRIHVDYGLSPQSVFEDALRLSCFHSSDDACSSTKHIIILWEFHLAIIPGVGVPSWLPFDLGQTLIDRNLSDFPREHERASENLSKAILDGAKCRMFDKGVISLDVFHVDTIKIVLRSPFDTPEMYDIPNLSPRHYYEGSHRDTLSEPVSNWLEGIEVLLQSTIVKRLQQKAREMFLREFFRTMENSTIRDLEENFSWLRQSALQPRHTQDNRNVIMASVGSNINTGRRLGSCWALFMSRGRSSYCLTTSGKFGRCTSQGVEAGDIVCMIPHGNRLHVFRPVAGTDMHKRIATAWFCGWSQGEAAILANTGELRKTVIKVI